MDGARLVTGLPDAGADIAARLDGLDVCAISDALDALRLPGAVAGILPVWEGARVAGRAITMTVTSAPGQRSERHLGAAAIDRARPGEVIVVHQQRTANGALPSAAWGGLLARAAQLHGIAGVVIDGACRDVDEIRELGLPVSARAILPFTARRRCIQTAVGDDVLVDGVTIATGDIVVADGSGTVFVRAADLDAVLARARRVLAREQLMIADLTAGAAASDVLGRDYEDILDDQ
jgi:4-hydroxy-4-methyl-2-oxoglutarate aldolase